jgi:hypothetical protein
MPTLLGLMVGSNEISASTFSWSVVSEIVVDPILEYSLGTFVEM